MAELAFESGRAAADLARALCVGKLAKQNGDELMPTAKAAGVALGLVLGDGGFNRKAGKNCNSWLKMLETRFMAGRSSGVDLSVLVET